MVTGRRGVTIRRLLLLGLAVMVVAYLVLRIWTGHGGAAPPASWGGLVALVFIAGGVFFAGLPVRRFQHGQAKKPFNPIRALRTLVLAQASALAGALVAGWYLAQFLLVLPDFDIASRRSFGWRLAALAAGGVLLAVAGMVVQSMCRVDGDQRDHDHDRDRDGSEEINGNQGH